MNSHNVLTAPNKTLTAPASNSRRPSNFISTTNNNTPLSSPRSPSLELSDSFSVLSAISQPQVQPNKYTAPLHHKPSVEYHHFFSASQLASIKPICSATTVTDWEFLSVEKYPASHNPQDAYDLEMTTIGLSIELAANNTRTRNFNKLLSHLLGLLKRLQTNSLETIPIETYNTLFLIRVFTKQFAGNLTNKEIIQQFEDDETMSKAEELLESLLYILINMDPNSNYSNYEFYTEVLNTFLVLCSTQLQHSKLTDDNYFLGILMSKFGNRAETVVARLLENLIEQRAPPAQSSSVMYTAYNYFFSSRAGSSVDADTMPVADRSLLLLLLLGSQSISKETENSKWIKLYRYAIANLNDHHVLSSDMDGGDKKMHLISFKNLFEIFIKSLHIEERMLLFYFILVENESFRVYVLSRTDQETIYLPILKLIYESVEGKTNYSQVYILMTILLILSQDDVNNEAIQKIIVYNITWFTERPLLKSISLGGLMTLVLIRTLQLNLSQQKDIFLHTNCLAILANMSNTMSDMHAYVAQRIVSLFELLARRFTKLVEKQSDDVSIYEDLLALILEIINSTLTHRLKHNSQLVYALLQKREIFAPFQLHQRLSDLVQNLDHVIHYFNARVSEANLKAPSSNEVLRLIEQASRTWSNAKLVSLPDIKFQYEEERDSYEFFIPYIWALVHRRTFIYWSEEKSHVLDNYRLMNEEP
ncbi:Dyggve-Melchior-Clausen syndrome protein-domain-containing protein [Helicostylum pulchrum]|nr:Dyggve-Melchior-Clausen syndrome protein-domain-containing protein [Helicostylum pulchrum]